MSKVTSSWGRSLVLSLGVSFLLQLPSEIEAKGKKQLTNAKKLLSDEMQNRNKAIAAVAAEHIMAIGDLVSRTLATAVGGTHC